MRKVLYILGQLSDDDVEWLATVGRRERIATGTALITEGNPIDSMFILLDGRMAVSIKDIGVIATLSSGEIMGEMSLIDSRPPSASVLAETDCVVLAIPRQVLLQKLETDVAFTARFYKAIATFLSDRLRGTVQRLGYGSKGELPEADSEFEEELNINILNNLYLAGGRFDRMLKRLMGMA